MENETETQLNDAEESQSFVIRMWQENPGVWRGTVRHVQSAARMGFTQLDQASRFIGQYTGGVTSTQVHRSPEAARNWRISLGLSRRTAKLLAFAAVLLLISVVSVLAAGHGTLNQVLGFGH